MSENTSCKYLSKWEPVCLLNEDDPASCGHDHLNSTSEEPIEKDCYEECPFFRPIVLKYGKINDLRVEL